MQKPAIFIYPGSFDPVTNGHLDIIVRASRMCDLLIVAIGQNREKHAMFTVEERIELIKDAVSDIDSGDIGSIKIVSFSGLLADFTKTQGASVIVKGLRAMSDFEYEYQMAMLNKYIDDGLETIFLMTNVLYTYLSSSAVKELAVNGADIGGLVPKCVNSKIMRKIRVLKE